MIDDFIKVPIRKNKCNNQINLNLKKSEMPKPIKAKFNSSKILKLKRTFWEDIDFE